MYYFDPLYILFALPPLILVFYAQWRVSSTYNKYSRVPNSQGRTGGEIARHLLAMSNLEHINVELAPGKLSDHYDPGAKVLRLSQEVAYGRSVAAMGIVAHEIGHAVQDQTAFGLMRLRTSLVPAVNLGSSLGYILLLAGIFLNLAGLAWIGVLFFSAGFIFTVVTLPVEWNASERALAMLQRTGLVGRDELSGARSVLSAAALTYVAAMAQALGQLLYFVFLVAGIGRRSND